MEGDKVNVERKVDLDTILVNEIGQFGRYQLRTLALAAVVVIFAAFHAEYVFTTARINTRFVPSLSIQVPIHSMKFSVRSCFDQSIFTTRCLIPECEESSEAVFAPPWILNAVPSSGESFADCLRFGNASAAPAAATGTDTCPAALFDTSVELPCEQYVYENTQTVVYDVSYGR